MLLMVGSLILIILKNLTSENMRLLITSTRYLMNASILKRGKVEIYENNGLQLSMVIDCVLILGFT
jgi:hypothetical protein